MRKSRLVFTLVIGTASCILHAQQPAVPDKPKGPNMPGMNMPAQQTKAQQPAPKQKPNRTKQPPDAMPGDMKGMRQDDGNPAAKAAAASEQNSVDQQAGQNNTKPGANSDAKSITVPIQEMQESEASGFHTGNDLPAPELLREVVNLQPMTVENFIELAEKSNPTLAQAQRNVDRSTQQARQVSLLPDPIVGYSGDHIRGGSYQGGEQGAFFSQVFVLGRKLALRRDIYRAEGRSNQFAAEVQRARVHDDVARTFFHTLAAQQSVVIHDRLLKVALDAETNAHELQRIGQADASGVLSAEIASEQAKSILKKRNACFLLALQSWLPIRDKHPCRLAR
jgi:cobalt-zinc-cadmium efflux system outer membrane protein